MDDNQSKWMFGIWSLTPGQVVEANKSPLPPTTGRWYPEVNNRNIVLTEDDGDYRYDGDGIELEESSDGKYRLRDGDTDAN